MLLVCWKRKKIGINTRIRTIYRDQDGLGRHNPIQISNDFIVPLLSKSNEDIKQVYTECRRESCPIEKFPEGDIVANMLKLS